MINVNFDLQVFDFILYLVRGTHFKVISVSPDEFSPKCFIWDSNIDFTDPYLKFTVSYFKIESGIICFYCF